MIAVLFDPRHPVPQQANPQVLPRHNAKGPRRRRGVHRLGLDELHLRSADGATFFVLVVAHERSAQLRASIPPPKNFSDRKQALRVDKKIEIKIFNQRTVA